MIDFARVMFISTILVCSLYQSLVFASQPEHSTLRRGAFVYQSYCSGCHALRYQPADERPFSSSLMGQDAQHWFGKVPPDLSLIVREKGASWLQAYLRGFYNDSTRPFGTNNHITPWVVMPDVFASLREDHPVQFNQSVDDLVHYLSYVAEPVQWSRKRLGCFVLCFLVIFLGIVYRLSQ